MKWAQTAESVLMTIELADCENIQVDVDEERSAIIFR